MSIQHHIVVLEAIHCPIPEFRLPSPHTYEEYDHTSTDPDEIFEKIKDASIVVTTIVPITPTVAAKCPKLQLIAAMATGCGWVDRPWYQEHGITVINCPQSNIPAVTEHALGLYFAVRKRFVQMHNLTTTTNEWAQKGTLTKYWPKAPPSASEEKLCLIGYGSLCKRFESLARAVGMTQVFIADRKGVPPARVREGRIAFEDALKECSVFLLGCPKDESTINLIDEAEFRTMRNDAILINMARGGIVNEAALAEALSQGQIAGAATDVFDVEPGVLGQSPLLPIDGPKIPNLTVSPHISWFAERTILTLQSLLKEGVENWARGQPVHVIVQGACPR